jgi:Tol biopolymer transport system component
MFAISPDGQSLVYQARVGITDSSQAQPPVHLFRRDLGSLAPILLAGADSAVALSISPDGQQLAFVSGNQLMRMPLQGGAVSAVASLPPGFVGGTDWRDNEHLLVSVQHTLYEISIKDGQLNTMLPANAALQQITGPTVVGTAGATVFAYVTRDELPRVYFLAGGSKTPKPLMMGTSPHYVPAWKALVVNRQGRLLAFPFDPVRGDTLGAGVPIAEGVALRSPVIAHAEYDVSPAGVLILTRRQQGSVIGWSPTSRVGMREAGESRALPLPITNVFVYELHFSPDGKRLLMTTRNYERDGMVFAFDFERQAYQRISGDEMAYTAVWAGSADSVIYVERLQHTLKIRAADGTGTGQVFADLANWQQVEQLDMRGDYVAFSGRRNMANASLDIAFVKRGQSATVTSIASSPNDESSPAISPDGKWLAYEITQSGKSDVYVSPFPDAASRTVVSTNGGRQPVWSRDGRTLSFVADNGAFLSVPFTPGVGSAPPTFGAPRELYRRSFARFWTLSPDGTKLLTIDTSALLTLLGLEVVIGFKPAF